MEKIEDFPHYLTTNKEKFPVSLFFICFQREKGKEKKPSGVSKGKSAFSKFWKGEGAKTNWKKKKGRATCAGFERKKKEGGK